MIFQALVRRRSYLLTFVTIIFFIICNLPIFAGTSLSALQSHVSSTYPERGTIVSEKSFPVAQQNQSLSLFQQLNLTEVQHQQIKRIHSRYRQKIQQKRNNIALLQQQLSDMIVGTEPVELLRAKNQQLNFLHQEIGTLRFECILATREILTLQQREKFRELVNSRLTND